jgi:hypothetical protein
MIFVSSARPMGNDPQYDRNQLAAKASWDKCASKIVYFNDIQPQLRSPKTWFVDAEPYPRILDILEFCMSQEEWCAILNADIVVGPNFPVVEAKLRSKNAMCASSWRYNFDPAIGISSGVHNDNGIDFFAATPEVWGRAYELCQEELRLGSGYWDGWMLSVFGTFFMLGFWNLTPARVIFHPNHSGRIHGPHFDITRIKIYQWPVMPSPTLIT